MTAHPKERPAVLPARVYEYKTDCGHIYIAITDLNGKPFEIFANMGKAGGCAASQTESICRLASVALRSGVDALEIQKQLTGIMCDRPCITNSIKISSCADAIGQAMRTHLGLSNLGLSNE